MFLRWWICSSGDGEREFESRKKKCAARTRLILTRKFGLVVLFTS